MSLRTQTLCYCSVLGVQEEEKPVMEAEREHPVIGESNRPKEYSILEIKRRQ